MLIAQSLKFDFNASIVVFLVALPLALGISIASGYPPAAGIISGVVGGILVGMISGSPLQVSGAAAGLTVLVFDGVQRFGLKTMGTVVILAGIFQIIAAALKLGRWFQAVSPTVLHAMLAGIGILIVGSQIHVMLDRVPVGDGLANLAAIPEAILLSASTSSFTGVFALGTGLLTIATMVIWPRFGKSKLGKIPAPLAAIVLASVVASLGTFPINFVSIPENLFGSWQPSFISMSDIMNTAILGAALQLALIASAESLLCAGAVDHLHDGPRTKYGKELAAQGIGNAVCGFLGALPITGVIVRSSANVHAGGKTRLSSIMHGCWLLLFVAFLPGVLKFVPIASLAGLLVFTGIKLVNVKAIRGIKQIGPAEVAIYAVTLVTIISVDLLVGVVTGLVLSGLRLFHLLSFLSIATNRRGDEEVVVSMKGAATFLRLPVLSSTLEGLPAKSSVVFESEELHLMDHACLQHLEMWRRRHVGSGGKVYVEGGVDAYFGYTPRHARAGSNKPVS